MTSMRITNTCEYLSVFLPSVDYFFFLNLLPLDLCQSRNNLESEKENKVLGDKTEINHQHP